MDDIIRQSIYLENTRLIYSGIKKLYDDHQVPDKVDELIESASNVRSHPLYLFLEFMNNAILSGADLQAEISNMLAFYTTLENIRHNQDTSHIPALFETLCNNMKKEMNSSICYLLYSQRDQTELLSISNYHTKFITDPTSSNSHLLSQTEFDQLRSQIQHARNLAKEGEDSEDFLYVLSNTVYLPKNRSDDESYLLVVVLDSVQYPRESGKGDWVYIVFQRDVPFTDEHKILSDEALFQLRNILFLREEMLRQCLCNIHTLIMAQDSYQYVPKQNPSIIRILHITDLHVDSRKYHVILDTLKNLKKRLEINEDLKEKLKNIDLLAITGDVVQADQSAGLLEQNYQKADSIIRHIASYLWSKEDGMVQPDWKKRIMITTGNHDYASMNELQVSSIPGIKRATAQGYPSKNEGGPMVKFAYYVEFICKLLDLNMNQLIENDLNEVRCYQTMGISATIVNTNSAACPLRNNKVRMNLDQIKRMTRFTNFSDSFSLLLCHHHPLYHIDYLDDRYGAWDKNNNKIVSNDMISDFRKIMQSITNIGVTEKNRRELLFKQREKLLELRDKVAEAAFQGAPIDKLSEKDRQKYIFFWDILRICDEIENKADDLYSEQLSELASRVTAEAKMTDLDNHVLTEQFKDLLETIHFQTVLAGHIHSLSISPDTGSPVNGKTLEEVPCIAGDIFLKEERNSDNTNNSSICFGITEIRFNADNSKNVSITYFPYKNDIIAQSPTTWSQENT